MRHYHYQVTHGLPFEICAAHTAKRDVEYAKLKTLAEIHGAMPDRYLMRGSAVEGLGFLGRPPRTTGWNASRAHPGYMIPARTKAGKAIKAELDAINIPATEKLAVDLGCEPFFRDLDDGGMYCANISIFAYAGTYYLQACKWCRPKRQMSPVELAAYGIQFIEASVWHKADEDRLRLEREPAPNAGISGQPSSAAPLHDLVGCEQSTGAKP